MLFYTYAIKRFVKQLWSEPQTLIMGSLLMLMLGLPIITFGISVCIGVYYMFCREAGIKVTFKEAIKAVKPCMGRAFLMGLVDITLLVACVSAFAWLFSGDMLYGFLSAVYLYLALFYLSTSVFRYPALVHNQELSLLKVAGCSMAFTMKNFWFVFMYWCVILLVLLVSVSTAVCVVLIFPAGVALLMVTAWSETLKRDEHESKHDIHNVLRQEKEKRGRAIT